MNTYYQEVVSNILDTVVNATITTTNTIMNTDEQVHDGRVPDNNNFYDEYQHDDQHHHNNMNDDNMDTGGSFCQASMGGSGMIMYMDGTFYIYPIHRAISV